MTRFVITLTAMQQRALTLGLTAILISTVLWFGYSFVAAQWEHHKRVVLLVRELSAGRALVEQIPEMQQRLARVAASTRLQKLFVAKPAAGQPGPLGQLVVKYGGSLSQSKVTYLDTGTDIECDEEAYFTADITALTHILYVIRSSEPLLIIHRMNIEDVEAIGLGPRTTPNRLQVDMTVTGFEAPK